MANTLIGYLPAPPALGFCRDFRTVRPLSRHTGAGIFMCDERFALQSQRVWPRPMPSWWAFDRSAGTERFICLEILAIGVLDFECALRALMSSRVYSRRLTDLLSSWNLACELHGWTRQVGANAAWPANVPIENAHG
jgi:hypothetical protein